MRPCVLATANIEMHVFRGANYIRRCRSLPTVNMDDYKTIKESVEMGHTRLHPPVLSEFSRRVRPLYLQTIRKRQPGR